MGHVPDGQLDSRVHQASGMVAAQLACTIAEALALMKIRAEEAAVTLEQIAIAVLDRAVRFDDN